jgi:L-Ala-D/L-Glu epimerase
LKLVALRWARYRLPFAAGFTTAHGAMRQREGLILWLSTSDGTTGLGDAAPLIEFGGGDIEQTESALRALAPALLGVDLEDLSDLFKSRLGERQDTAALRCGLDTATLDLQATHLRLPLAALLSNGPAARSVAVNATIGEPGLEQAVVVAQAALAHGFRTVKLKIAMTNDVAGEVRRVAAVREALCANIALRLDANGGWSPDAAIAILSKLAAYDIEFVEQPVIATDIDGLARVRRASPIAIAADEAVTSLTAARRIIEHEAADVLIIKPMVCGGLRVGHAIIELASAAGLRAVVTSSIESGIGLAAALHLAATLPAGSPACGLATAELLVADLLVEPLTIIDGRMLLPDGAGLSVVVDEAAVGWFGDGNRDAC